MPLITVDGIVVRNADYKENDRMLTVFTREYGALGVSVRGCRRKGSTMLACSEPFSFCEFVLFENRGRYSVNSFLLKEAFYPLREDIDKLTAASFAAELASAAEHGNMQSDELFSTLYYALSYICYGECHPVDMALCFAIRFLSHLGYSPSLTSCALCGRDMRKQTRIAFAPALGGALCSNCVSGDIEKVSAVSLEAIRRIIKLKDEDMQKAVLPERVRSELLSIIPEYAEIMLERTLKSAKQLGK